MIVIYQILLENSAERWYSMSIILNKEVITVARTIKHARQQYLTDMDKYISKLETMSGSERKQYAQKSLTKSGIITKSGRLSPKYK